MIAVLHERTNAHRMYDLKIKQVLWYRFEESFFWFFPCQHSLCKPVQKTKKLVYHRPREMCASHILTAENTIDAVQHLYM